MAGFQNSAVCLPEPASHVIRTTSQNWESEIEEIPQVDVVHHCPTFLKERLWECRCLWSTHSPTGNFMKDRFNWHAHEPACRQSHLDINCFQPTHAHNCNCHGENPLQRLCVDVGTLENPLSKILAPSDVPQPHRSQCCFPQSLTHCAASSTWSTL